MENDAITHQIRKQKQLFKRNRYVFGDKNMAK